MKQEWAIMWDNGGCSVIIGTFQEVQEYSETCSAGRKVETIAPLTSKEFSEYVLGSWILDPESTGHSCIGGVYEGSVRLLGTDFDEAYVKLKGIFCADQLEALAWWIRRKETK